jgi:phosphotransferase family enzyme
MREHLVLVPNQDRTALLVVDGRLPAVRAEDDLRDVLADLERTYGVRAPFLRTVRRDQETGALLEIDAASAPGEWLPLDAVDPESVAPAFADGVEQWLAEQRGAPVPPERPPWARPGWLASASVWVAEQAGVEGEPELVRQWPLSAVYRFATAEGPLYLKAVFALFRHEPAVTAALAAAHPGDVPDVVAIDRERGLLLMREFGPELGDRASPLWVDGVRVASRIQREWVGRLPELAALGAPTRRLDSLAPDVDDVPALAEALAELAALGLPDTIVHGDLHPWNAAVEPHGLRIVDWSDAAIGCSFLDLGVVLFTSQAAEVGGSLVDAYLEPWAGVRPEADLRRAAQLAEVLGCVYQSQSYRAINAAFEPTDRTLFAGELPRWRERAVELAARL